MNGQKQIHPSLKLSVFLLMGALPFFFQDPRVLAVLLLVNLCLVSAVGWTKSIVKTYLILGLIGSVFTAITWVPFMPRGEVYWQMQLPLIGIPLQITHTGILWGAGMGLRIANVALLSVFYLFTTPPREISAGLKGIGVPFSIGFLVSLVFRVIPMVRNDLAVIREAQMVRGLDLESGSFRGKIKKFSSILVPLIFTSLKRVQLMANALDAKGFKIRNGQHRLYRMPKWKPAEIAALVLLGCAVIVLFYYARIHSEHYGVLVPERV